MSRAPILRTYKTFLSSWSIFTGNEIPAPKTLAETCGEPIVLTLNLTASGFLNKTPPAWAKGLFITIKKLTQKQWEHHLYKNTKQKEGFHI